MPTSHMNHQPILPPHPGIATDVPDTQGPAAPRTIDIASLLGPEREVQLLHNGEIYRLRVTARNRLILTK